MSEIASGTAISIWNAVRSVIYDRIKTYLSYIQNYEKNLNSLCDELEKLCMEKKDVDVKVLSGKDRLEKLTFKATHWLAQVQAFSKDEEMKRLMIKDMEIAKAMLRLMKSADLKKLVEEDREMRALVVTLMKDIAKGKRQAETGDASEEEEKDKEVGGVLEKLMEETMDEFKTLMQNDKYMSIAALHLLENHTENLKRLTDKDKELADIIAKAREMSQEEELLSPDTDDNVLVYENTLREKVKNLLKPVKGIILDEELLKALPENVALGMKAMGVVVNNRTGLKAELMDADNTSKHRNYCCCVFPYNYFSDRHDTSVAATAMLDKIKVIIADKPGNQYLTRPMRRAEMVDIPTNFVGLESRKKRLMDIVKALATIDVQAVGIFGMGGSGKTTLAKEIANSKANGIFQTTIMVEVSVSPNIEFIQDQIANRLGLDWHNVHGINEKATRLYNKLKPVENPEERKQKDNNNSKKTLIVLDNIWEEIDLLKIGIPREYCKLLLTSRTKDVCKKMDVLEANIFEVGLLNKDEAEKLFKFQVQREVTGQYKSVAHSLLEKCGGLPLSIVATANSLKGKELPLWRQFAEELDKPISCQITGAHYETFLILKTSYEVMASEEKKKFFLLACLSPVGSSILVDNLMRYGIGLGLFQHVDKLSEAIEAARTWAEELVSSSMLLKGNSDEYVKIHDVVRESTMSSASKSGINTDGQMFLVDAVPRWIFKETFNKYTGISLLAQANFACLSGVKADLLQILLFKGNENYSSSLDSDFFQGMTNLKVLEVSFMNFEEGLPKSMGKLKVLKTLHLVKCKLRDMRLIGELESLLVLSLHESSLDKLPDEIGKLRELRLLDLSKCRCKETRIPINVIARLSLLEGLYLADSSRTQWAVTERTSNEAAVTNGTHMDVFNNLEFLNVLEIRMSEPKSLPIGAKFVKNLDKFNVIIGQDDFELKPSQRALIVSKFDVSQELKKDNCLKALLKKADFLVLKSATVNNIVPELDTEGFRDLGRLELSNIDSISKICEGKSPTELFCNLSHLEVSNLEKLEVLLPVNSLPRKMTTLQISKCNSLEYIFSQDNVVNMESDIIELPCLRTVKLDEVTNLISMVKESNNDDSHRPSFFNSKVTLTSLEELSLKNNKRIVKLCDMESNHVSFQNLKVLEISHCEEMESIGPSSMFISLVQLERLTIKNCKKMQQVISDGNETGEVPKESMTFPNLKHLEMWDIENLGCFYGGSSKMGFPCLKHLILCSLKRMTRFAGARNSTAFFTKTIEFPCLEDLWVRQVSDEVRVLWELHEGEGQGISSIVFPSLCRLTLESIGDANFLSSSSENEGCAGIYSQFPKLEELKIVGCSNSAQQIVKDDGSTAMLNFCGQLKSLVLESTSNIQMTSLDSFKSLHKLSISGLTSEYLFSVDCGFEQLQSLEVLFIMDCPNLKVIIQGRDKDKAVVFPRLKSIGLLNLESMSKLCSISGIPLRFPSLEILNIHSCHKLEPLFCGDPNQVVELPALKYILISEYSVKSFSTRPLKAPNLRELDVSDCHEMEWFLLGNSNWNADLELSFLEEVTIKRCPNMKSFSSALLRAPRLRKIDVEGCNKWEWIFDEEPNQVVELPSLEEVRIYKCDAMKSFSTRSLKAPKLRQVNVQYCPTMECFLSGNSNSNSDLELSSLEEVTIRRCPNMKSFSPALLRAPRLRKLYIEGCNKWEWLFDGEPNQVIEFPSLEELSIYNCAAMKSFSTRPLKAPKLRQLTVYNCPAMEFFLSGNSNCDADLELPSLEEVTIKICPKMKSLSPALLRAPKLQLVNVDDKLYPIAEIEDFNHFLQSANNSEQTAADKIE